MVEIFDVPLLDAKTLLAVASVALAFMATAQLITWLFERRQPAPLWMGLATALCCLSAVLREALPQMSAIVLANVTLGLGLGCIATACRVLGGRKVWSLGLLLAPLTWLLACLLPAFMASQQVRTVASSLSCTAIMTWAVAELLRDRNERLKARFGLVLILSIQGLAAFARAVVVGTTAPHLEGAARTSDVMRTTFWSFGSLLMVGFGVMFLMRERSEKRLRFVAEKDALTGLANRRSFDEALGAAFVAAKISQRPMSLLMIDADAFKAYNDRYGHPAGDRALRAIASVLSASSGRIGLAARYGGEEFTLLLPNADGITARRIAKGIGSDVQRLAIEHDGSRHGRVTVSIGFATLTPTVDADAAELVSAADQALYAAKDAGRDCVRSSPLALRSGLTHQRILTA